MTLTAQAAPPSGRPEEAWQPDSRYAPEGGERTPAFRLPHGLLSARFGLLVGAALVAGLVSLLAINTSLAAGAIEVSGLESSLARSTERQQALQMRVDGMSSPAALQAAAIGMGMVPAGAPAFLDPATGAITGAMVKAVASDAPNPQAQQVTPPQPDPDAPSPAPGTGTGLEPDAQLVMPPDPGADGASVTRPRAAPSTGSGTVPPTGEEAGDAAAVLPETP